MAFSGFHDITDLHDADSAFGLGYIIFSFLGSVVREHILQLLCGYEEDIMRKDFLYVIVLDGHKLFCFPKHLVYNTHHILQRVQSAFFFGNNLTFVFNT